MVPVISLITISYRNFLMLCTGLMEQQTQPLYLSLLDTQPSPSVRSLQSWVHSAWDNGQLQYFTGFSN